MNGDLSLIDLFCCAGGASEGYRQAGFTRIVGVDLNPPKNYPFEVIKADANQIDPDWIRRNFDGAHASPPCQFGTILKHAPNAKGERGHLNLIPATRLILKACGLPYSMENVPNVRSHLHDPVALDGSMFDLGSNGFWLKRQRLFECNFPAYAPCRSRSMTPVMGIYGAHVRVRSAKHGGRRTRDLEGYDKPAMAREAMQMPWATLAQMSEAIPPAYTRWLGSLMIAHIQSRKAA